MKGERIIRLYWLICFLFGLCFHFFGATYVLFLRDVVGLNKVSINMVNSFFALATCIFELPTGAFADRYGRKTSFVIACFVFSLSLFIYFTARTFMMCVIAELLASLAFTFQSGALDAWVVDGSGKKDDKIFARGGQLLMLGHSCSSLAGGYIGQWWGLSTPWLCGSIAMIGLGIFSWKMMDDFSPIEQEDEEKPSVREIVNQGVGYSVNHRAILCLILFSAVVRFTQQPLNMFWSLRFEALGLNPSTLGWVAGGFTWCLVLGKGLASWLKERLGSWKSVIYPQLVTATGIILSSQLKTLWPVLSAFYLHEIGRGTLEPREKAYLHVRIPEESKHLRATISSFRSVVVTIGMVLGLLLSGLMAEKHSIQTTWFVFGFLLVLTVFVFAKIGNGESEK